MAKAAEMIPEIEKMLPKLDSIMSTLNSLLADPALRNSLHNMESVTGNLATTTDQANKLLAELNNRMPGMMTKADNVLANAEEASGKLAKLDVAGTMAKVDATLANVEQLTRELNNPNGTVGKLLKDPALYDHITQTVKDADSLVIDLKQHPKRYVHFSLF